MILIKDPFEEVVQNPKQIDGLEQMRGLDSNCTMLDLLQEAQDTVHNLWNRITRLDEIVQKFRMADVQQMRAGA